MYLIRLEADCCAKFIRFSLFLLHLQQKAETMTWHHFGKLKQKWGWLKTIYSISKCVHCSMYNSVESDAMCVRVCVNSKSNSTFYHRIGNSLCVTLCSASRRNMIDRHRVTHHSFNAVFGPITHSSTHSILMTRLQNLRHKKNFFVRSVCLCLLLLLSCFGVCLVRWKWKFCVSALCVCRILESKIESIVAATMSADWILVHFSTSLGGIAKCRCTHSKCR